MAQGQYKNGVQINLVYQAAGLLSNAIPVGTVYDEGSAVHSAETTALTSALLAGELGSPAAGRYLGHFTPDAEGMWTVVIKDKNGAGEVTKMYDVAGHDLDSVGDTLDGLGAGAIASQLLLTKSTLVSSILADMQGLGAASIASQLLLTKSALVSAILVDEAASASDIKSAITKVVASQVLLMISAISDVESAVDLIASPASVS